MGHIRVGRLPKRYGWPDVVLALQSDAKSDQQIIEGASKAAVESLGAAKFQSSLNFCYWLFLSLVRGARGEDFSRELRGLGISVPESDSAPALITAITSFARDRLRDSGWIAITDELALQAFQTSVADVVIQDATTLFGANTQTLQAALRKLSTKKNVSNVARHFFSEFMYRLLSRALDRQLSDALLVGSRFQSTQDVGDFHSRLRSYCWDVSQIVEDFAGGWYSKHTWLGDVSEHQTEQFTTYAMEKLFSEIVHTE
jgi:hypothetical protein